MKTSVLTPARSHLMEAGETRPASRRNNGGKQLEKLSDFIIVAYGGSFSQREKVRMRENAASVIPRGATGRRVLAFFIFAALALASLAASAGTLVQFRTTFGDLEVELYDQDKPVTVQNFLRYIQTGRYENEFSHRLVPGFVLQGGGFTLTSNTISAIPAFPPITNEFGVGKFYSNVFGTIAMAKLPGNTNSATSQWFFNLADNTFLDAPDTNNSFVVFGHVIQGTNVLNEFNQFKNVLPQMTVPQSTNLVLYHFYAPPFDTLPVLAANLTSSNTVAGFAYTNFVFLDITLLQVAIQPVPGGREISWNSAAGMTNVVEFTTQFPPDWSALVVTNGTGARMAVMDASPDPQRFYRVRVAGAVP